MSIPNRVRAQQVQSEMEAADSPKAFLSLVLYIQLPVTTAVLKNSSSHLVPGSKNRCSPGSLPAECIRDLTGSGKYQGNHCCSLDFGHGKGNAPSFSCIRTFANQSSATNHVVLRFHIVRRYPDNRARQVNISDSSIYFSSRQVTNMGCPCLSPATESPTHNRSSITGCT